jgi:CubicO group peptidase (beta-lactamase class C family)
MLASRQGKRMHFRRTLLTTLVISLVGGPYSLLEARAATHRAEPAAQAVSIDDAIGQQMREGGLVGVAAAVIVDGKVAWRGGYGWADRESGRPFTTSTVMNVASISKTVVGAAMMRAQEEGKLSVDADIDGYLPFQVRNPRHPATPITLRQIATHTSSITDRWDVYAASYHFGRNAPQPLDEFLRGYFVPGGADYSPENYNASVPGTERDYSNIGAGLAGYIVERRTGQPLDRYTEERIFRPLGMDSTHWRLQPSDLSEGATQYLLQDGIAVALQPATGTTWPDGGLRTSVDDLSTFFIALLNGGQGDAARILKKSSVDEMLRLQLTSQNKPSNVDIAEKNSGLFWQTKFNTKYVGHGGSDPGLKTEMLATPDLRTGIVFFTNTAGPETDKAYVAILKLLFARAEALSASGPAR